MITATVVTYNPDIEILENQFESLKNSVDKILYIDNNSKN
jgi:hypothetical protein